MPFIADRRLYLNEDKSKVVEENSPDARFLLASEGTQVTDEDVKKYGLKQNAKAAAAAEEQADAEKPDAEAKQIAAPPDNKARSMRGEKDK